MTLRDELEKKLRSLYFSSTDDVFGVIADEVLRQMEWARKGWLAREDSAGSKFYTTASPQTPLTLAPEDWKP